MAAETAMRADVHAHVHPADLPAQGPWGPEKGPESTSTGATRARVIQLHPGQGQEDRPQKKSEDSSGSRRRRKARKAGDLAAAADLVREAAADSDLAEQPMTAVEAWEQIAPGKGEAGGKIKWLCMTAAGLTRALFVTLGHLIIRGSDTRIKAGVLALMILLAVAFSALAGAVAASA